MTPSPANSCEKRQSTSHPAKPASSGARKEIHPPAGGLAPTERLPSEALAKLGACWRDGWLVLKKDDIDLV